MRQRLAKDTTGHDWFHTERVRNVAKTLARVEEADSFIVEMAALLHDTIDDKLVANEEQAIQEVVHFLKEQHLEKKASGSYTRNYSVDFVQQGNGTTHDRSENRSRC